ncbi:MAG: response regulator [Chloroflexi bacterium]|nr:response regulator [Chloroflexota bacterium]
MTNVYIADALPEERSALRLMLVDLGMEGIGEAADWHTTLANAPATSLDMLLVDWALIPSDEGSQALAKLRAACANSIVIVMISHLEARQQAVLSIGADEFISRSDTPDRVAERLRIAATWVRSSNRSGGAYLLRVGFLIKRAKAQGKTFQAAIFSG